MGSTGGKSAKNTQGTMSVITPGQSDLGQVNTVNTPSQAQQANAQVFSDTDDGQFRNFYGGKKYYQSQTFSIDTQIAVADYLYDKAVDGTLYSPSQNLNYHMQTDAQLTGQEIFMRDSLLDGMHNLGYNMNLERYGRVDYIDNFGKIAGLNINANNFSNMSEAQLKKAFIGLEYGEKGFVSASYNQFKNAPAGNSFTDKAVKINIKAPANAQALMPGIGPGGNLGEIVLAPNQRYRITNVRFTGKSGRSGANTYKQIEFDVEMY